jgi:Zn-dependent protease
MESFDSPPPSGIRLGSIAGTTIHLQISFLILVGLFVLLDLESGAPLPVALLWLPVAFLSVLLHELGHAAALAALGFGRSQITLGGLGGLTFNPREAKPWQDLLVSLAGPVTSYLLYLGAAFAVARLPLAQSDPMLRAFLPFLANINRLWAFFNILPIAPLDGGQAVRNLLRIFLSERTAAYISAGSSALVGGLLVLWSLSRGQFFIAILGVMLTMQNLRQFQVIRSLRRRPPDDQPPLE